LAQDNDVQPAPPQPEDPKAPEKKRELERVQKEAAEERATEGGYQ
jgi:hypothetical protein